jgi:hypothetical protein
MENQFDYLTQQQRSWNELGYDVNMQRILEDNSKRGYSTNDVDAYFEDNSITSDKINSISARKIASSILANTIDVGSGVGASFLRLDGPNNRFTVHDESVHRIVIGNR